MLALALFVVCADPPTATHPIDRFLDARLAAAGITPAPEADRRTLLRRLTYDLTGLPPTPEEADAFLADAAPDAFARLADRLLASPAYGERWGRHWLDVARYADSRDERGMGGDADIGEAWRYRDWVIDALNRDMPYDRFVRLQVAGDIAAVAGPGDRERIDGLVATGLLTLGEWGTGDADKEKMVTDIVDDQIDVVGKAFLGMTLACARCHDHKFDPITQADYTALAGIFFSTRIIPGPGDKTGGSPMLRTPVEPAAESAARSEHARKLAAARADLAAAERRIGEAFVRSLQAPGTKLPPRVAARAAGAGASLVRRNENAIPGTNVIAYRDAANADLPAALLWPGGEPLKFLTFTLPAGSVCLHPSPDAAAALRWTGDRAGPMAVRATVTDVDGSCGDGVAVRLVHQRGDVRRALFAGQTANGGRLEVPPSTVEVAPGDALELVVLPGASHSCDMTAVSMSIEAGGKPVADSAPLGRAGVLAPGWSFHGRPNRPAESPAPDAPATPDHPYWPAFNDAAELALLPEADRAAWLRLRGAIGALERSAPGPVPVALAAQEGGVPGGMFPGFRDVPLFRRGKYTSPGEVVPRRFPVALAGKEQPPIRAGSGRRELADWLASPNNPLTAKVMANRVWASHFGRGIVGTPSNFGKLGEPATHPELLDFLAKQLVDGGWSLKKLHRLIVTSAAYRRSGAAPAAARERDPDNKLLGRIDPRRLEAEALRDTLLAATGELDRTAGGPAQRDEATARRTVYTQTIRSARSGLCPLFDAADPETSVERRTVSTVAPQALFLLNSPFARQRADALARRLLRESPDDAGRVARAYRLLFARPATPGESAEGLALVRVLSTGGRSAEAAWAGYAQVLLCANELAMVD